jgi:cyclase
MTMRSFVFGTVLAGAALLIIPTPVSAQAGNKILRATHVAGSVQLIDAASDAEFVGGNVAVCVGADGIVMVDTLTRQFAPQLRDLLRQLSDKPLRWTINTHAHFDHSGGNSLFGAESAIVAHSEVRAQMLAAMLNQLAKTQPGAAASSLQEKDLPLPARRALPSIAVDDKMVLHVNGEQIEIRHFPRAHSSADLIVYFRAAGVVHMGDLYFSDAFPYIAEGGSMVGLIQAIDTVLEQLPADTRIIPGHGTVSTPDDLRATLAMLRETRDIVLAGIRKNISLKAMQDAKVLGKFARWEKGNPDFTANLYLEQIYKVLRDVG